MATAKLVLYPFVTLNNQGELTNVSAFSWKTDDEVEVHSGHMRLGLPEIQVTVEYPEPEQLRAGAVQAVQEFRRKKQAEYQLLMNSIQYLENSLLRLSAPEVLDKEDVRGQGAKAVGRPGEFGEGEDDDMPF